MPARCLSLAVPNRSTLLFIALCLLWYSTSFLSASTSKALLSARKVKQAAALVAADLQNGSVAPDRSAGNEAILPSPQSYTTTTLPPLFPYPVSLTAIQFFFVFSFSFFLASPAIASFLYQRLRLVPPRDAATGRPRGLMGTLVMVDGTKMREMIGLSVFNVTGHAMTSAAIQMVPVSTVHTVKALSPLFTVLTYVFLLRLSYPLRTYLSLLPLTMGVVFACSGLSSIEGPNVVPGLTLSVGSTIVFVAQNLWSKKLLGHALAGGSSSSERRMSQGNQLVVKLDKLNILFWSSAASCLLMMPVLTFSDFPRMMAARSARLLVHDLNVSDSALAGGWAHADASIPLAPPLTFSTTGATDASSQGLRIASLLFSNGVTHFSQNLLAFSVLGLTSPVTYSIASLFKRVFVICFAILWFGQTVTQLQWAGIFLTFIGLYLYNDSKVRTGAKGDQSSGAGRTTGRGFFEDGQSFASREEEAAMDFGLDKSSRRRAGLLPTSGGGGGFGGGSQQNDVRSQLSDTADHRALRENTGMGGTHAISSAGPIWKGMSSTTIYSGGGQGVTINGCPSASTGGLPSRSVSLHGYGIPNGHAHTSPNGHGRSPVREGPKRD